VSQLDERGCLDDSETNDLCCSDDETEPEGFEGVWPRTEDEDTGLEAVSGDSASNAAHVEMKVQVEVMARDLIDTLSSHNFCRSVKAEHVAWASEKFREAVEDAISGIHTLVANRIVEPDGLFAGLKAGAMAVQANRKASSALSTVLRPGPASMTF
jgi:hypothetical protein